MSSPDTRVSTLDPLHPRHDIRLLPAALVCWACTAVGIFGGSSASQWVAGSLIAAAAITLGVGRFRTASGLPITASLMALFVVGGCCSGAVALRAQAVEDSPIAAAAARGAWIGAEAVVREDPTVLNSGGGPETVLIRADITRALIGGQSLELGGRVSILAPQESWNALLPGQSVTFRGRLSRPIRPDFTVASIRVSGPPTSRSAPATTDRWAFVVRRDLAAAAKQALSPSSAALLPGLVVGDVSAVPKEETQQFRTAGLSHLLAVSGANFSIVLGSVLLILRFVGTRPRIAAVVAGVVLLAFVIIVRPSPSVLRAAGMGAIGLLALVTGRRKQALPALLTAVIGLLVWWPELAVDFGFGLSVVATAALVVLAPVFADWFEARGWMRAPAEIMAVACAAHVSTAPIVAGMSGTFSAAGIVANILVAPAVAPITVVGAAAAVLAPVNSMAAQIVLHLASGPLWWLTTVAQRAASAPHASFITPSGFAGAALVVAVSCAVVIGLRWSIVRWCVAVVCGVGAGYWIVRGIMIG